MIVENFIELWQQKAPWRSLSMVEQDLIISRVLINLFNNELVANSLVFRGGTALNKIYINPPARYSEDIDLVQIRAEPIDATLNAIQEELSWLGKPAYKLTERSAKLVYRYKSIDNLPAKLKIEINTTEHFQLYALQAVDFVVDSDWFHGETQLITYELDELMGTKFKALYQRRKGRDLFDLWLVLKNGLINIERVLHTFDKYCNHDECHVTRALFEKNLDEKCQHKEFKVDMHPLLARGDTWDFDIALEVVHKELISLISGKPWKGFKSWKNI